MLLICITLLKIWSLQIIEKYENYKWKSTDLCTYTKKSLIKVLFFFGRETALESKFCKTFLSFRIIEASSSTNLLNAIKTNYVIERGERVRKVRLADFFKESPFIFLILEDRFILLPAEIEISRDINWLLYLKH